MGFPGVDSESYRDPLTARNGYFCFHKKLTVAQINAGYTIAPAKAGVKYRLVDAYLVSVGAASQPIDIKGTQSSSVVKLAIFASAGLTDGAILKLDAASNVTRLASNAWADACDAGAALTVVKDGTDVATATHVYVSVKYVVEPG